MELCSMAMASGRGGRRRLAVARATTRGRVDSRRWGRMHTGRGEGRWAVQVAADPFFWHDFEWSRSGNQGIAGGAVGIGGAERYED